MNLRLPAFGEEDVSGDSDSTFTEGLRLRRGGLGAAAEGSSVNRRFKLACRAEGDRCDMFWACESQSETQLFWRCFQQKKQTSRVSASLTTSTARVARDGADEYGAGPTRAPALLLGDPHNHKVRQRKQLQRTSSENTVIDAG